MQDAVGGGLGLKSGECCEMPRRESLPLGIGRLVMHTLLSYDTKRLYIPLP